MEMEWPLILFQFFVCASCGALFMQGLLGLAGKGKDTQIPSLLTSLLLMVIGGIAVFMHLQHWERMFNGFGHITSGITQELIGVVLMVVAIVLYFLFARRSEDGIPPKWASALAVLIPLVMVFLMAHSYLMPARVSWNSFMLIVYYFVNMALLGSVIAVIVALACRCRDDLRLLVNIAMVAGVLQAVVVLVYAFVLVNSSGTFADPGFYFDPTLPDVAMTEPDKVMASVLTGSLAPAFWAGAVFCGGIVPAVAMFLYRKRLDAAEGADAGEAEAAEPLDIDAPLGQLILDMLKSIPRGLVTCVKTTPWQVWVALLGVVVGCFCWRVILYDTALTIFAIFLH